MTGKVHLTCFDAVASINPDLARRTLDAERATSTATSEPGPSHE
jgi:hypothetical protein